VTPERWRQVTDVFHAVLARDAPDRASYLDQACAGDRALRSEVDAMLAAHVAPTDASLTSALRLASGTMIGPYRVSQLLGAGGMGEVYRARDTKLGRDVALKVLPAEFTADVDRLARFEREARMLAALNHPHIAAIYGFEEAAGVRALVLELVEGETLADRLSGGPIPVDQALAIGRQLADALEAAHEKGIIHRDLKPANIIITPDGTVKVLDFGLAKAWSGDGVASPDLSALPTVTATAVRKGVVMGTPAYMSPEQAHGTAVDKRTDIWSFGCVLYEMLAGTPAFRGETVSETLADVMKSEPRWIALPSHAPANVRNIVRRCLEKDPRQRVRDIGDIRLALRVHSSSSRRTRLSSHVAVVRSGNRH
jgi:serine/threonine-protein kinase